MTSIINPTDIQFSIDENIYATTNGGVIKFNLNSQSFTEIGFDEGLWPLDLKAILLENDNLFVSDKRGNLQVYDLTYGNLDKITHLDFIESIIDLISTEFYIYAIGYDNTQDGLLQFSREGDNIRYTNFFQNFPLTFYRIHDIYIVDDIIFLGLDTGLISANINSLSSNLSSEWSIIDDSGPIYQIADNYYFTDNSIIDLVDGIVLAEINSIPIDSKYDSSSLTLNWIDQNRFYELGNDGNLWQFEHPFNPSEDDSIYVEITSFDRRGDDIIIGIENHGITHISRDSEEMSNYIPRSILNNKISALSITEDGDLIGVGHEGGIYEYDARIINFYSYVFGYNYPNWGQGYDAYQFNYKVGDYFPRSIVESERGTYLFNNYGQILNSESKSGGLIEFDPTTRDIIIYGKDDGILDGTGGIVDSNSGNWYSQIPQLKKDFDGNVWALNAFAEHTNQIAAIQLIDGSWTHVLAHDTQSYIPTEFDFAPNGFVWFGFQRHDNPYPYVSSGGIKILNTRNTLNDISDDIWLELSHPDTLPGGANQDVYSLAFSKTEGEDVVWIMGNSGVQGYLVSGTNLTAIYPQDFYGNLGFKKGDRLKVDPQNNIWIITQHSGIRVIKSNTERWPTEDGFTTENSKLLSNNVYDITFDKVSGRAFIATDSGISILHIPFALDSQSDNDEEILLSPNPIYLPSESGLSIFSFPAGSIVRVMTLTGLVIKSFNLIDNENVINSWDCRMENGNLLSSGIYLVTSQHPEKGNKIGKLAVIRN